MELFVIIRWRLVSHTTVKQSLLLSFVNCFHCFGISWTHQLTTFAATSLHLLLLKITKELHDLANFTLPLHVSEQIPSNSAEEIVFFTVTAVAHLLKKISNIFFKFHFAKDKDYLFLKTPFHPFTTLSSGCNYITNFCGSSSQSKACLPPWQSFLTMSGNNHDNESKESHY